MNIYIALGAAGLLAYALDRFGLLGRLAGLTERRLTHAAHAAGAAISRAGRTAGGGAASVFELQRGCRLVVVGEDLGFGRPLAEAGAFRVTGSRWVYQRVPGKSTAEWREFALERTDGVSWLLVALKFMNKLVLMRCLPPEEFADGLRTESDAERFVLAHNRAGMTLAGGPEREALTVGRVGPVSYSDADWPHEPACVKAESFLAASEDKSRHLLARKESGRLRLWYGRVIDPALLQVEGGV